MLSGRTPSQLKSRCALNFSAKPARDSLIRTVRSHFSKTVSRTTVHFRLSKGGWNIYPNWSSSETRRRDIGHRHLSEFHPKIWHISPPRYFGALGLRKRSCRTAESASICRRKLSKVCTNSFWADHP